jgi:hypothetical protein
MTTNRWIKRCCVVAILTGLCFAFAMHRLYNPSDPDWIAKVIAQTLFLAIPVGIVLLVAPPGITKAILHGEMPQENGLGRHGCWRGR